MLSKWTFWVKNESSLERTQQVMLPMPFPDESWPGGRILCTKGLGSTYQLPWFRITAFHNPSSTGGQPNPRFIQVLTPAVTFSPGEEKEFELQIGSGGTNPIAEPIGSVGIHEEPHHGANPISQPTPIQPVKKEGNIKYSSTDPKQIFKGSHGNIVHSEPIKPSKPYTGGKVPICHLTGAVEFSQNLLGTSSMKLIYDGDEYDIGFLGTPKWSWGQGGLVMSKNVFITNKYKTEIHLRVYTTVMPDNPFIRVLVVLENQPYDQIKSSGDAAVAPAYFDKGVSFLFENPAILMRHDKHPATLKQSKWSSSLGYYQWEIWPAGTHDFLGHWQGKAWEFLVLTDETKTNFKEVSDYVANGTVSATASPQFKTMVAELEAPLWALPDVDDVREAKAWWFGGVKSPLNPTDWTTLTAFRNAWDPVFNTQYGYTWGLWGEEGARKAFGDTKYTHTTGTPRNSQGDYWACKAIQAKRSQYLKLTVESARAQAMRAYARCFISVLDQKAKLKKTWFQQFKVYSNASLEKWGCYSENPYRPGKLSPDPRSFVDKTWRKDVYEDPHGWMPSDEEHIAVEMLADAHIFTADPFAWDELDFMGKMIPYAWPNPVNGEWGSGVPGNYFYPAQWPKQWRPEGLQLIVGALASQITGDLTGYNHVHSRAIYLENERKMITGFKDTPYLMEGDMGLAENYTGYKDMKAGVFFQIGHYCHGVLAAGYAQDLWDMVYGACLPYHAWGLWDVQNKEFRTDLPAYYYELFPHGNSPSFNKNGTWKERKYWWAHGKQSGGLSTDGMVISAFVYAMRTHPNKSARALIESRLRLLLSSHGHAYQPNPTSTGDGDRWWEWWDAEET